MFQAKNALHNWLLSVALSELKFVFRVDQMFRAKRPSQLATFLVASPMLFKEFGKKAFMTNGELPEFIQLDFPLTINDLRFK